MALSCNYCAQCYDLNRELLRWFQIISFITTGCARAGSKVLQHAGCIHTGASTHMNAVDCTARNQSSFVLWAMIGVAWAGSLLITTLLKFMCGFLVRGEKMLCHHGRSCLRSGLVGEVERCSAISLLATAIFSSIPFFLLQLKSNALDTQPLAHATLPLARNEPVCPLKKSSASLHRVLC